MITLTTILTFIGLFAFISSYYSATVYVTFVKGFMIGCLINKEELEDYTEVTVQLCLIFITFTAIWEE
jgi:ABC-type nickel/cobalt efflux system permease component RcnA